MNPTTRPAMTSSPRFIAFQASSPSGPEGNAVAMNWLWRGYLAPGQITLLTSLWKSGKTTLLSVLLARMSGGGALLGQPVRSGRALVLSEEGPALWHMRNQRLAFGDQTQLISRPFSAKPTNDQWAALIDEAAELLGPDGGRLLVVDTVATLFPTGVETNSDCMTRALAPLRRLAEQDVAVLLMHHPHKGKTRAGQWARGTGSLPASVDIVLEMHAWRPDDSCDRRRLLRGHSRHDETPRRLLIQLNPDGKDYRIVDEPDDEEFDQGWSAIQFVLSEADGHQTAAEILRAWPADSPPPSRATLHRWLARAVERRFLDYEASNRKNAPYRYRIRDEEEEASASE